MLHGILAPPTGFITRWTSKNQNVILKYWCTAPYMVLDSCTAPYMMLIFNKYSVFNSLKTDKKLQQLCFHEFSECYFWFWHFLSIFALMWNIHTYTTIYYVNKLYFCCITAKTAFLQVGARVVIGICMTMHEWMDGILVYMLSYWWRQCNKYIFSNNN